VSLLTQTWQHRGVPGPSSPTSDKEPQLPGQHAFLNLLIKPVSPGSSSTYWVCLPHPVVEQKDLSRIEKWGLGIVTQVVEHCLPAGGPEFKQYCRKKKKEMETNTVALLDIHVESYSFFGIFLFLMLKININFRK
jgi:hypothetical protein